MVVVRLRFPSSRPCDASIELSVARKEEEEDEEEAVDGEVELDVDQGRLDDDEAQNSNTWKKGKALPVIVLTKGCFCFQVVFVIQLFSCCSGSCLGRHSLRKVSL